MLVLNSIIWFDDLILKRRIQFDFCTNIEIEKSRKTLTNTCKITIPRNIKEIDQTDLKEYFKPGLKVTVFLGYDGNLKKEFTGYITQVSFKIPTTITCQDEMWNLKQNSLSKAFNNAKLKDVVNYIYKGESRVADLVIGDMVIKQQSTAQVLDYLKKFALQAYFDNDGVLVVDFAGSLKQRPIEVIYDFGKNVIDNDLEFNRKDDIKIKVKGVSKTRTGKKIEFITGDLNGDERTLNYINIELDELKKIVSNELNKLKQDGLKNSFRTFGIPYCEPGFIAIIRDQEYPERNGSYLIESVDTSFGIQGFRRKITPERKLA